MSYRIRERDAIVVKLCEEGGARYTTRNVKDAVTNIRCGGVTLHRVWVPLIAKSTLLNIPSLFHKISNLIKFKTVFNKFGK